MTKPDDIEVKAAIKDDYQKCVGSMCLTVKDRNECAMMSIAAIGNDDEAISIILDRAELLQLVGHLADLHNRIKLRDEPLKKRTTNFDKGKKRKGTAHHRGKYKKRKAADDD